MARPPAQRHTLNLNLPEGLLAKFGGDTLTEGISKARIAGAVAAGLGVYIMVRVFQKTGGDVLRGLAGVVDFLGGALGFQPGLQGALGQEALLSTNVEPFAASMALVTAGMILAGQNPGEILKGIGEIIPL